MPSKNPKDRILSAKIAANSRWAQVEDRSKETAPGRAASASRYEKLVDPEGLLPPAERAKRAKNAEKAHFQLMALRSAQVRRRAKLARTAVEVREALEAEATYDEVTALVESAGGAA
jgi:hypothetical protein